MNFKNLELKRSYISCGDENIANSLLIPALSLTKCYRLSVGYFSSSVFQTINEGIVSLVRNQSKIKLITSPKLSAEDIQAINAGYAKKDIIVNTAFTKEFSEIIQEFNDDNLQLLVKLISRGILDIKIAVTKSIGFYHDKLGILEDLDGNIIVFYGSANSTLNGYQNNYEKVRIVRSWDLNEYESVKDEIDEFDNLWNGNNEFVDVYDFKDAAHKKLLEIIEQRKAIKTKPDEIKLRNYQMDAINAWVENKYQGFYVMATGTGKTWTAIFSAKKLLEVTSAMIVICAPYKHLIKQWAEDVVKVFPEAKIILVSSENPKWEDQINEEIIRSRYSDKNQVIVISTLASFNLERFDLIIQKSSQEKLLIIDEAHRFNNRPDFLLTRYKYLLGLSATPHSGMSTSKGDALMEFFGGKVYNLPLETALEKGFLVPYNYYPIIISATENEEIEFKSLSSRMAACFKNGVCIDYEIFVKLRRNRLRILSMAEGKIDRIDEVISQIKEKDHVVVYCGDGRLFDNDQNKELRHIQFIKGVLNGHGYKPSQFTASENIYKRMELIDAFNKGEVTALAAIRCLDEGINIPSIKAALILSSNDDYREFVQRRGRILRTFDGKNDAKIYDVIVLPSSNTPAFALIELKRYYEYSKLALNKEELFISLNKLLNDYGYTVEDVNVYINEIEEDLYEE